MMARVGSVVTMGAAGAGGAHVYSNPDLLDVFLDASGGSALTPTSTANPELEAMMGELTTQVGSLAAGQQASQRILVQSAAPPSILGVDSWKVYGTLGVLGSIYCKLNGWELRDLVYVSKGQYKKGQAVLAQKFKEVETLMSAVKDDVLVQLGLVEDKVDEARTAIEAKLEQKLQLVAEEQAQVSKDLEGLRTEAQKGNTNIESMTLEIAGVAGHVIDVHDQLTKLGGKVESSDRQMDDRMDGLMCTLQQQQQGIAMLCDFVSSQVSGRTQAENTTLLRQLKEYARQKPQLTAATGTSGVVPTGVVPTGPGYHRPRIQPSQMPPLKPASTVA